MFFYRFLYVFIWPLFRLLFHPKVRGRENIPKSGAIIFAGNHKSNLDCFLLATCLWRQVHFMAKDELFRGAAGGFFRALGTIPVNRRIRDASALSEAQRCLTPAESSASFRKAASTGRRKLSCRLSPAPREWRREAMQRLSRLR